MMSDARFIAVLQILINFYTFVLIGCLWRKFSDVMIVKHCSILRHSDLVTGVFHTPAIFILWYFICKQSLRKILYNIFLMLSLSNLLFLMKEEKKIWQCCMSYLIRAPGFSLSFLWGLCCSSFKFLFCLYSFCVRCPMLRVFIDCQFLSSPC